VTYTPSDLAAALRAIADDPAVPDVLRIEAKLGAAGHRTIQPANLDRDTVLAALATAVRERGMPRTSGVDDVAALLAKLDRLEGNPR
jgi:hypothetical protein